MNIDQEMCPGYRRVEAPEGLCCCGLYWQDYMPPHDAKGRLFSDKEINRSMARKGRELKAYVARCAARRELENQGDPWPRLFKRFRITAVSR